MAIIHKAFRQSLCIIDLYTPILYNGVCNYALNPLFLLYYKILKTANYFEKYFVNSQKIF